MREQGPLRLRSTYCQLSTRNILDKTQVVFHMQHINMHIRRNLDET